MKLKILLFFLIITTTIYSQDFKYLNCDTRLYIEANDNSDFKGYFKINAQVEVLSKYNDNWHLVKADNHHIGYVMSKFITDKYNSNQNQTKDTNNPILDGDQYYGGHHLFINVASLRSRKEPNTSSPIIRVLTTGQPVPVKYLPLDKEEWVKIYNNEYIQKKYINERPEFRALVLHFNTIEKNNIKEQFKIAERLVQLAWNSGTDHLHDAYTIYFEVVKQLNDKDLITDTEIKIALVNGLINRKPEEEIYLFVENAHFEIKNIEIKKTMVTLSNVTKNYGQPVKKEEIGDECGVYFNNTFYTYSDIILSVDENKNLAELVTVFINENNQFIINDNAILDSNITERDFINRYSQYLFFDNQNPHVYTLVTSDRSYNIEFKNGALYLVNLFYLC